MNIIGAYLEPKLVGCSVDANDQVSGVVIVGMLARVTVGKMNFLNDDVVKIAKSGCGIG